VERVERPTAWHSFCDATRMHKSLALSTAILGFSLVACSDAEPRTGTDASLDGTAGHPDGTDASIPDGVIDAPSELGPSLDVIPERGMTVEAGDAPRDRSADSGCPNPTTFHGAACSVEGLMECGRLRSCTDVEPSQATECTCQNGRFVCGSCPSCSADLRALGCGIGQVCDSVTFTRCDGSRFEVASTCSCSYGRSWSCDNDGGSYQLGACDAGADVPDADGRSDAPADDADATALSDADGSSCTCSASSSNPAVASSLACACQQFACPTYDVAVTQCPPTAGPPVLDAGNNRLMLFTYTACNLVAVERTWAFDTSTYVYDATTHELVGARNATDVNRFTCGSASVFALQGGVFPLNNCAVIPTQLCARDASTD
jgi:hypothetical protein